MAKVSAHGEQEVARWECDGRQYLMTNGGRVLWKSGVVGDGWKMTHLSGADRTVAEIDEQMARMGYQRKAVRR